MVVCEGWGDWEYIQNLSSWSGKNINKIINNIYIIYIIIKNVVFMCHICWYLLTDSDEPSHPVLWRAHDGSGLFHGAECGTVAKGYGDQRPNNHLHNTSTGLRSLLHVWPVSSIHLCLNCTENDGCNDANFVVIDVTGGCRYDNIPIIFRIYRFTLILCTILYTVYYYDRDCLI